jgi:arginine N-succinyltransferase
MLIIRPIKLTDLDPLHTLSHLTGFGLTTLPRDEKLLRRRIRESLRGFEKLTDEDPPRGETYLFVLEETDTGQIVGTSGIVSKVGGFEPFYAYRQESVIHESKKLGVHKQIGLLHLVEEHDGPCEIGSLFLSPDHRKDGNGRLLSLARFLFMADHKEYFDPIIIAEMRGVVDDTGRSPFWEAVGRHFFHIDFVTADYLSMIDKKFIAELMPEYPIYVPLLPKEAQEVIGQVQDQTAPALRILEDEGFQRSGEVDIFEAGPVVKCHLNEIRTIRDSTKAIIEGLTDTAIDSDIYFIANTRHDFRATKGKILRDGDRVKIEPAVAQALGVVPGDPIRFVAPKAPAPQKESADAGEVSLY